MEEKNKMPALDEKTKMEIISMINEVPVSKPKGYTLEEIADMREFVKWQANESKKKITEHVISLQKSNPFSEAAAASSLPGKMGHIALKLLNGLNYIDYAILGFSLFKGVRKVTSLFRKNKK